MKSIGRRSIRLRKAYLWAKFIPGVLANARREMKERGRDWAWELNEVGKIKDLEIYECESVLTNDLQPQEGRNFLAHPSASWIKRNGVPVGWCFGQKLFLEGDELPFFQSATDVEINLPLVFDTYRPSVVVDFGTAFGATALLFHELIRKYESNPQVMSVDINDVFKGDFAEVHTRHETSHKVSFFIGDSLKATTAEAVRRLIESAGDQKVLLSFDDDHATEHVLEELKTYGSILRSGDVIIVQDTWNQGLRSHAFSPLLAVLRFLRVSEEFALDIETLSRLTLPCSFVHGVLVRR